MNYNEELDLMNKVQRVCQSVEHESQLDVMNRYVARARNLMTDPQIRSNCMFFASHAAFRVAPIMSLMHMREK